MIAPPKLVTIRLKPGELLICHEPCEVTTVLGSCLAVTMFNARLSLAAICHVMLPDPGLGCRPDTTPDCPFKFVSTAIPAMTDAFRRASARPEEIEVKMFGGGNVLVQSGPGEGRGIGQANIQLAELLLQRANLRIKAYSVGGHCGRKIVFNTLTGEVFHKHLT